MLLLMVAAAIATQAQSLTGKYWYADMSDKENSIGLILVYDVQGQCMVVMVTEDKEEIGDGALWSSPLGRPCPAFIPCRARR